MLANFLFHFQRRRISEFHTSNNLDLGNTVGVTEDNTDLGRSGTLLGQLADVVNNLVGGGLEPRGRGARVGESGGGNTLALAVKTTHFDLVMCPEELSVGVDEKIENR
jgi:hypothetical protein